MLRIMTTSKRITLTLIPAALQAVNWLSEATGLTSTDVVNRAVQLYRFYEEKRLSGAELVIRNQDGSTEVVRVL